MSKPQKPDLVMSPLADPVIAAIFANIETSGEAASSIVRAVLESNNNIIKGNITNITPQRSYSTPKTRGCRVDVHVETDQNEYIIVEVQINPDKLILQRNLFSSSRIITETSRPGDDVHDMAKRMPRIIHINLLAYNLREDNTDLVQPFEIMYTKAPVRQALDNFSGYNVQLPRVLEMTPDFTNPLYCWCYILYKAHMEEKTLQEVIDMTPEVAVFANADSGYKQFCDQYDLVATNPESRNEYYAWINYHMRVEGELEWAREAGWKQGQEAGMEVGWKQGQEAGMEVGWKQGQEVGREEGREAGREEGREEGMEAGKTTALITVALNLLSTGATVQHIIQITGLPAEEIAKLK